jgi:uncharacterized protein YhdP
MKRVLKVLGVAGIAVFLLFGVAVLALYHLIQVGELRRFLISEFERRTHLKVQVGEAEVEIGRIVGVSFRDFALLEPNNDRPVIAAPKILIRVALMPLLERKLLFYGLRLYEPKLQVARDAEGKFSLLELMLNLPFREQEELRFNLDLRDIRVEKGELTFFDYQREKSPTVTHFRGIELALYKPKAKNLPRLGVRLPSPAAKDGGERPTLEFAFRTIAEIERQQMDLSSKGKILFPKDSFEMRQAWLDADLQSESLPAALLQEYLARLLPLKAVRGALSPRLHWEGSLAEGGNLKGEIRFKQVEVEAPSVFANLVAPGDGRAEFVMDWKPQEIRFRRLDFHSQELSLILQGFLRSLGKEDPYVELQLTSSVMPLVTARKYIPFKAIKSPRLEYLATALNQGDLKLTKAGISGRLSEIRRLSAPGFEKHLWLDAELRDAGGSLGGEHRLPLRDIAGRALLEKGVLYFKGFKGAVGLSRLTEIEGSHKGVLTGAGLLELRLRGDLDLAQIQEQIKLGLLPAPADKVMAPLQELGGKARLALRLRTDFTSPATYEGEIALDSGRLRVEDVTLSQIRGQLSLSPKEVRTEKTTALLSGSPLHIRAVLRNYLSDQPTFDLTVDSPGVKAGEALHILLSLGNASDPGTVRGTIHYQGSMNSAENRKLSGSLELIGAQLPFKFLSQPLRDVSGRVRLEGKTIDFQGMKGKVAGYGLQISGRWSTVGSPQLNFSLSSPEMDVGYLLPQDTSPDDDFHDRLQVRGKFSIDKGRYEGFEFSDLKADLSLDNRVWRSDNFSARSEGGTVQGRGTFVDAPGGSRISVEPKVQGVALKGLLSWFELGTTEITGKVNLAGSFDVSGNTGPERKRNLNGAFHLRIEDGVARRFQLLVRVLSFLDLSRWFSLKLPDVNQEGIRFRSVTGDFKVSRGVYSTQNLFVDSDDLRITGAGEMDGPKGEIDFVIAVRPFPGIDSAVNYIPLLGTGLAAIKNSLLVASFHVKGPMEDPTLTPAPLSTLSEFFYGALAIPKGIIGAPTQGNK